MISHTEQVAQLEATVKQFLDQQRMFTAYDVTIETRNRLQCHLRHKDLNGAIHEIALLRDAVDFGHDTPNGGTVNYQKFQKQFGNNWAFVYHPAHLDPANYQAIPSTQTIQQTPAPAAPTPVPPTASISLTVSDSGGQLSDGTFEPDFRNRLLVPTRFFRELGKVAGDKVYVLAQQDKILIVAAVAQPSNSVHVQTLERNGHMRLSEGTLNSVGMTGCNFVIKSVTVPIPSGNIPAIEVTKA